MSDYGQGQPPYPDPNPTGPGYGSQPPAPQGGYPQQYGQQGHPQQFAAAPAGRAPIPGEVADLGQRALARIVDSIVVSVLVFALSIIFGLLGAGAGATDSGTSASAAGIGTGIGSFFLLALFAPVLYLLYEFISNMTSGQTLGKKFMKIRIVNEVTGGRPSGSESFIRVLLPNLLSYLCGIGLLVYISPVFDGSGRMQGWHDRAAKTAVVKVR